MGGQFVKTSGPKEGGREARQTESPQDIPVGRHILSQATLCPPLQGFCRFLYVKILVNGGSCAFRISPLPPPAPLKSSSQISAHPHFSPTPPSFPLSKKEGEAEEERGFTATTHSRTQRQPAPPASGSILTSILFLLLFSSPTP